MKPLIAYFTHSARHSTQRVANTIHVLTNGDLLPIIPIRPYPAGREWCEKMVTEQLTSGDYPALCPTITAEAFAAYDLVYLGYPAWMGTLPPPVCSFLAMHDFAGKHIVPFSTYENSGLGDGVEQILSRTNSLGTLEALAFHVDDIGSRRWERTMIGWTSRTCR